MRTTNNKKFSKTMSANSQAVKADHYLMEECLADARTEARSRFASAIVPDKYQRDKELADA